MLKRHFINNYSKIKVDSENGSIYINCRNKPAFTFKIKNAEICTKYVRRKVNRNYINIYNMLLLNDDETMEVALEESDKKSYLTLSADFSNLPDLIERFRKFAKTKLNKHKCKYVYIRGGSLLNYISYELDKSNRPYRLLVSIRDDFRNFDNHKEYDFEIAYRHSEKYAGKIVCDGRTIKTENCAIKLLNKHQLDKFTVKLDKEISDVEFYVADSDYRSVFDIFFNTLKEKYDVYFNLKNISDFKYLKLLDNINQFKRGNIRCFEKDAEALMAEQQNKKHIVTKTASINETCGNTI